MRHRSWWAVCSRFTDLYSYSRHQNRQLNPTKWKGVTFNIRKQDTPMVQESPVRGNFTQPTHQQPVAGAISRDPNFQDTPRCLRHRARAVDGRVSHATIPTFAPIPSRSDWWDSPAKLHPQIPARDMAQEKESDLFPNCLIGPPFLNYPGGR